MCGPIKCACDDYVVLRTADGIEQTIKYRDTSKGRMPINRLMRNPMSRVAYLEIDGIPQARTTQVREYKYQGRRNDEGLRIYEEYVVIERPVEVRLTITDQRVKELV